MDNSGLSSGMQAAWDLGLGGATRLQIANALADQHETFNISQTITVPAAGLTYVAEGGTPAFVGGSAVGTSS